MKRIEKDELFTNLSGFLNTKGIELKDGTYTKRIQQGCSILADLINIGQDGFEKAKTSADDGLDRLRQAIHEKTAPRPPKTPKSGFSEAEAQTTSETNATRSSDKAEPEPAAKRPRAKKKAAKGKTPRKRGNE